MRVTFKLAMQYAGAFGTDTLQIALETADASLGNCLDELLRRHPDAARWLELHNFLLDGQFKAMFIRQDALISLGDAVQDGDAIRVMLPISGG